MKARKIRQNASKKSKFIGLFSETNISADMWYRTILDPRCADARGHCTELWAKYYPYASRNFPGSFRRNFHQAYWEMLLSVALMEEGYTISCPVPGPDVGIIVDGKRVWFEAVAPSGGVPTSQDRVVDAHEQAHTNVMYVPEDQILLRCLTGISAKLGRQREGWLKNGIVTKDDAYVVAINMGQIALTRIFYKTDVPRIIRAAYPIGPLVAQVDERSGSVLSVNYSFRPSITKKNGESVETGVFFSDKGKSPRASGIPRSYVPAIQ